MLKLCKKNVVNVSKDGLRWEWKSYELGSIMKSEAYKDTKVVFNKRTMVIGEAYNLWKDYQNHDDFKSSCAIKESIWKALDDKSQYRIKTFWNRPEVRIASVNKEIEDDNTIIACYPYYAGAYQGELQEASCGYTEWATGFFTPEGEQIFDCDGGFVMNTNSTVFFGDLLCDIKYKWLYKVIEQAKSFGVTPRTEEGFYKIESYEPVYNAAGDYVGRRPVGVRGMCITVKAAKELRAITNWYTGNADLLEDYSDTVTIHHADRVGVKDVTQYEYDSNRELYEDWKEMDSRDCLAPLYASEEDSDIEEEEEELECEFEGSIVTLL